MSNISNSEPRKIPAWKVSDTSRIFNNDNSASLNSFQLPDRFTPSKGGKKDTFSIGKSKEKGHAINRKISGEMESNKPINKQKLQGSPSGRKLAWKQSRFRTTENQTAREGCNNSKMVEQSSMASVPPEKIQRESKPNSQNRQLIRQIKQDFSNFKCQIVSELTSQKEVISKISEEIMRQLIRIQTFHQESLEQTKLRKEEERIFDIMDSHMDQFQDQIRSEELVGGIKDNINQYQDNFHQFNVDQPQQKIGMLGEQQPMPSNHKIQTFTQQQNINKWDEFVGPAIETPLSPRIQQGQKLFKSQKINDTLQKCNRIVETISILSQINASPVRDRNLAFQKIISEQYKKKLIASVNNSSQPSHESQKEPNKDKSHFRIDKFYNTIQRLRGEVNDISPSKTKQASNDRALKAIF